MDREVLLHLSEDLLSADATYSSFPWAGGHCVTGATKPHGHTVCVSRSPAKSAKASCCLREQKTHQLHEKLKLNLHC